ncbi:MAG TPA: hypothetical protein VJH04_00855 [archaeon]|nr:hypothetical protein [archaeon]
MSLRKGLMITGGLMILGAIGGISYMEGKNYPTDTILYLSFAEVAMGAAVGSIGLALPAQNRERVGNDYRRSTGNNERHKG